MPNKKSLVIIGRGGHARVATEIVLQGELYDLKGYIDKDDCSLQHIKPCLGDDDDIPGLIERDPELVFFIGIGDNFKRRKIEEQVREAGGKVISLLHSEAIISPKVTMEEGAIVMAGCIINSDARLGANCIINTGAIVEHDCDIGQFASVGPGAVLGGEVKIGDYSAVGIGATILHGIKIGEDVVIGAGAVVTRDIPANVVAYGVPAKIIRKRNPGEPYL